MLQLLAKLTHAENTRREHSPKTLTENTHRAERERERDAKPSFVDHRKSLFASASFCLFLPPSASFCLEDCCSVIQHRRNGISDRAATTALVPLYGSTPVSVCCVNDRERERSSLSLGWLCPLSVSLFLRYSLSLLLFSCLVDPFRLLVWSRSSILSNVIIHLLYPSLLSILLPNPPSSPHHLSPLSSFHQPIPSHSPYRTWL